MINFELHNKIINCEATTEELMSFFPQDKSEFDKDDSFEKYFDLDKVKRALHLYRTKKINVDYLSHWACAYDWIISATLWSEPSPEGFHTLKENLVEQISDWLDGVSFFDESDDYPKNFLSKFYKALQLYYDTYKNIDKWTAFYVEHRQYRDPDDFDYLSHDDVFLLFVNDTERTYYTFVGCLAPNNELSDNKLSLEELDEKLKKLKQAGYKKLYSELY